MPTGRIHISTSAAVLATLLGVLGFRGVAMGQYDPRTLQPVEQGLADLGPLSISTRMLPLDLRQPQGFERVYRVPGSTRGLGALPSGPTSDDYYARVNGAITAVFPRSDYVVTKSGIHPAIPGGTVFYIGNSPLLAQPVADAPRDTPMYAAPSGVFLQTSTLAAPESEGHPRAVFVDRRVRMNEDPSFRESARPGDTDHAENIFVDEQFRRFRVRQLLACRWD